MKTLLVLIIMQLANVCFGQIPAYGFVFAKEFSKEIALYRAKEFVFKTVLGESTSIVKFQIDPLAASNSGELTSLVYRCSDKNKEGLILGFFGSYWNEAGVAYQGFNFKDIPKEKALPLLNIVERAIDENSKYLKEDVDNNNIYFHFDDITFLIYTNGLMKIRVFWNGFDSEWDMGSFKRTKRRLLNKLDD